ncbi:SDR family oxidoreductase [Marinilongibacter aquaticus]|uniref:SDR family NAD(P)-dependent oxidoreductase n=1 Tax=Marinilongibacter aquaticus TaxID=2975157 RepID=UPI0021BD924C|nr:SDR family oxidoreductase [Marinilongibacter aquaticus]UBM57686.1 SDR family oxidoreductase [Marinilongibacter aquaticus]
MFRLDNKVAVVTGGASGIGLAISQAFAKQGATVHIFELNKELAQREADLIIASGGQAYCHTVDVSKQDQVRTAMDKITAKSKIDVLVNNAGIAHVGNAETTTEADLDKIYNVNIKGVYNCIHVLVPHFKQNGGGCIINMASVAATVAVPDRFAYSIAKGAVYTMTMQVARDYVRDGIRCNSISPARIHTPFVDGFLKNSYADRQEEMFKNLSDSQPIGRMGKPSEVAAMAVYLASDEAGFNTGTDYLVDGGFVKLNTP